MSDIIRLKREAKARRVLLANHQNTRNTSTCQQNRQNKSRKRKRETSTTSAFIKKETRNLSKKSVPIITDFHTWSIILSFLFKSHSTNTNGSREKPLKFSQNNATLHSDNHETNTNTNFHNGENTLTKCLCTKCLPRVAHLTDEIVADSLVLNYTLSSLLSSCHFMYIICHKWFYLESAIFKRTREIVCLKQLSRKRILSIYKKNNYKSENNNSYMTKNVMTYTDMNTNIYTNRGIHTTSPINYSARFINLFQNNPNSCLSVYSSKTLDTTDLNLFSKNRLDKCTENIDMTDYQKETSETDTTTDNQNTMTDTVENLKTSVKYDIVIINANTHLFSYLNLQSIQSLSFEGANSTRTCKYSILDFLLYGVLRNKCPYINALNINGIEFPDLFWTLYHEDEGPIAIPSLKYLSASQCGLTSSQWIAKSFPNLVFLDLCGNKVKSVDVIHMIEKTPLLIELHLVGNLRLGNKFIDMLSIYYRSLCVCQDVSNQDYIDSHQRECTKVCHCPLSLTCTKDLPINELCNSCQYHMDSRKWSLKLIDVNATCVSQRRINKLSKMFIEHSNEIDICYDLEEEVPEVISSNRTGLLDTDDDDDDYWFDESDIDLSDEE